MVFVIFLNITFVFWIDISNIRSGWVVSCLDFPDQILLLNIFQSNEQLAPARHEMHIWRKLLPYLIFRYLILQHFPADKSINEQRTWASHARHSYWKSSILATKMDVGKNGQFKWKTFIFSSWICEQRSIPWIHQKVQFRKVRPSLVSCQFQSLSNVIAHLLQMEIPKTKIRL